MNQKITQAPAVNTLINQPQTYASKKESAFSHKRENPQKGDIYAEFPVRLLGFTNEVGAAISPIIGPVGELISYAPALSYIFADANDKFKRGEDGSYEVPSKKKAVEQLAFQAFASVIFPTAAVKTAQAVANKLVDSSPFKPVKDAILDKINSNEGLKAFIHKFADKPESAIKKNFLNKFAKGFQKTLDVITVFPLFFKHATNKSGVRNLGLAAVGLTALSLVIKPIDKFCEHVMIDKIVRPILYRNSSDKTN